MESDPQSPTPESGLGQVLTTLNRALNFGAGLLILVMMTTTLYGVFTCYVLRDPAIWTPPITGYLLLWSIYMAAPWALQSGDHVRIEFVLNLLSGRVRRVTELVGQLLSTLFLVVLTWQVGRLFLRSWDRNSHDTSMLHLPLAPIQSIMVVGTTLMVLAALFLVGHHWRQGKAVEK